MRCASAAFLLITAALGGCSPFVAPSAVSDFASELKTDQDRQRDLLVAFRRENASLLYISGGQYSCGDPSSKKIQNALSENPDHVLDESSDPKLSKDLHFIETYAGELDALAKREERVQQTLSAISEAARGVSTFVPQASGAATAASLARVISGAAVQVQIQQIARRYQSDLNGAVEGLRLSLAKSLVVGYRSAFDLWNDCAMEKLAYIREVHLTGKQRGLLPAFFKAYGAQPTSFEMDQAYNAYLDKRDQYLSLTPDLDQKLRAIVTANERLAKGDFEDAAGAPSDTRAVGSVASMSEDVGALRGLISTFGRSAKR